MCQSLGHEVDVARNGEECLSTFKKNEHELVLMDLHMPRMDGITATERLFENHPDEKPRVVAVTAAAFEETREQCLELGMENFITKPVRLEDLRRAIDGEDLSDSLPMALDGIDMRQFRSLMSGELGKEIQGVFEEFVDDMCEFPQRLKNLWDSGERQEFIKSAHSVRGSAGTFGLRGVNELLGEYEVTAKAGEELPVYWFDALSNTLSASITYLENTL